MKYLITDRPMLMFSHNILIQIQGIGTNRMPLNTKPVSLVYSHNYLNPEHYNIILHMIIDTKGRKTQCLWIVLNVST